MKTGTFILQQNRIARFIANKQQLIVEIISALFILLFTYTALSKLTDLNLFRYQLQLFPFIKPYWQFISWSVPTAELVVALLLFIPRTRKIGLYGSLALMIGFIIYLTLMVLYGGKDLPCTCGGVLQKLTWKQHIVFNSLFVLLAAAAIWLNKRRT